jgi:hypothetical protein
MVTGHGSLEVKFKWRYEVIKLSTVVMTLRT